MAGRLSGRTPEVVILAVLAALAAGALLLGGGGGGASSPAHAARGETVSPARIALIERRVEALRGLRFRHPVPVAVVSPAQARREGLAEYDRSDPVAQRRENEELLKLLGLLPAGADLRKIEGSVFGEQVAGYYDPRRKRLALVRGAGVDDVTLAHELTHALEDQHADLGRLGEGGGDDASTAQQALVEGSATLVMERYAARWPSSAPLGDALAGLTQVTGATPLPAYTARTLVLPVLPGRARSCRRCATRTAAAGDWSTWRSAQRPPRDHGGDPRAAAMAARAAAAAGGGGQCACGWRMASPSPAPRSARRISPRCLHRRAGRLPRARSRPGGAGGRYALWRRGPLADPGCPVPCRARDAVVLAVRMRDAVDGRGSRLGD